MRCFCLFPAVRSRARELIEALYGDEVQKFLESSADIVDETDRRKVVRNGYHKERTILATCGCVPVKLPRIDDKALDEKDRFVSRRP
jgi:putative transposase